MKAKVEAGIRLLKSQGHTVETQVRGEEGRFWFEVDRRMLVSWEEMQHLADCVYTLEELEDYTKDAKRKRRDNDSYTMPGVQERSSH